MSVHGITPPKFIAQSHELGVLKSAWKEFKSELEIYFLASGLNSMPDERKVALMMYQMGRQYQKVLSNEFNLSEDERKVYKTVVDKFDTYFEPKKLTASYINKFQNCRQGANQTVNEYITELKEFASLCEFGNKEEDFLAVQICNGVRDVALKKKLWGESLKLKDIIEKCQLHELREAEFSTSQVSVNAVNTRSRGRGRGSFSRGQGARNKQFHVLQPSNFHKQS